MLCREPVKLRTAAKIPEVSTWVLPPTRALWIPAGLPHETASDGVRATMRSLYIRPGLFRVSWDETGQTPGALFRN